jgi:excinuclease ABC subunit B
VASFELVTPYQPQGDQPQAIAALEKHARAGAPCQVLLGVTGSGKTFTIASLIQRLQRPTLIISHNKTLAAQLYGEFKSYFPKNRVEYFVSYYDYYQPEAYVAATDTFIEKDSSINDEIDRLRLSATHALLERRDTVIVSSVSCIYGLGDPDVYRGMFLLLEKGKDYPQDALLRKLVEMQYVRGDMDFFRGRFRVRGDSLEVYPAYGETAFRMEFFGDTLERVRETDALTGKILAELDLAAIYPAKHFVMPKSDIERAVLCIQQELKERLEEFHKAGKLLEAQRLEQRTRFDLEMLRELGTCQGIENYSRHLEGRAPGLPPKTLLDYLPPDALVVVDESHVSLPQVRGMFEGDLSRKRNLVEYGFRLPSAIDNRPLYWEEFLSKAHRMVCVSATPGDIEMKMAKGCVAEQIIRPTGLTDPEIEIRPCKGQVDDLMGEVRLRALRQERTLVTTLTKRMAEELSGYYQENGIRVKYLHADIETFERVKILMGLRQGEFDCLVGINLLREGLDLPEVSLVAILDADKEGFLRSDRALIQTMGRAARNVQGRVILYADRVTGSMERAMSETSRRREKQLAYNKEHNITPETIVSAIKDILSSVYEKDYYTIPVPMVGEGGEVMQGLDPETIPNLIVKLEKEMRHAAQKLEFERAGELRDQVSRLRGLKPGELLSQAELFAFSKEAPTARGSKAPKRKMPTQIRGGAYRPPKMKG